MRVKSHAYVKRRIGTRGSDLNRQSRKLDLCILDRYLTTAVAYYKDCIMLIKCEE